MMKKNIFIRIVCSMLLFALPIVVGCKKISTDKLALNVDTDVFSAPTMLVFENAKDGAINQPLEFSVTISGPDKDKVVSVLGTKKFDVHDGWLALNLEKGVEPSLTNPIRFVVTAKIAGFEDVRKEITLVSNDELTVTIHVIEKENLPSGITEESKSFRLYGGGFYSNEIFSTFPENNVNETVTLTFSGETQLRDKDNNQIFGDSVRANVRYYGVSDESVDVFPGGLSPQNVLDKNGNLIAEGVNFFTAGMIDLDMNVGGKEVKYFDKPVKVEMGLNANQDNFMTGQKVKAGDSIPVWSLDKATWQWKEEMKAVVVQTASGLAARFEIRQTSGWNLDWRWRSGDVGTALNVKFDASWINPSGNYDVILRSPNGGYLGALYCISLFDGYNAIFEQTPNIPLAYIVIYDNLTGKIVYTSDLFSPITKGALFIKLDEVAYIEHIDVALTYSLVCAKKPILKPNPPTWISIKDIETGDRQFYFTGRTSNKLTKGRLDFRLVNGRKYKVSTVGIDGELISCEVLFDLKNPQYQNIKGLVVKKLEYDAASKKVIVDCEYTTDKC